MTLRNSRCNDEDSQSVLFSDCRIFIPKNTHSWCLKFGAPNGVSTITDNIWDISDECPRGFECRLGLQKYSKNLGVTSKHYVPKGWQEASSVLRDTQILVARATWLLWFVHCWYGLWPHPQWDHNFEICIFCVVYIFYKVRQFILRPRVPIINIGRKNSRRSVPSLT